jgi:hypothetical protein
LRERSPFRSYATVIVAPEIEFVRRVSQSTRSNEPVMSFVPRKAPCVSRAVIRKPKQQDEADLVDLDYADRVDRDINKRGKSLNFASVIVELELGEKLHKDVIRLPSPRAIA